MTQVSVVIPVYNSQGHLERCLASIAVQTLREIEVICVDDGSIDASPGILNRWAADDLRFHVLTQKNAGPGSARNAGFALASGKYTIFLDSDDWFEPDFLEEMVRRARETDADITICRSEEFDTQTGETRPSEWMLKERLLPRDCFRPMEAAKHLLQFTYGWTWDKLYRTRFIREAGISFPELPNSEDLVFVFQSLAVAERIAILSKTFVHHRINRIESVSNSRRWAPEVPAQALMMLKEAMQIRGVYDIFEQSFMNWAMEFLIWNVANMGDKYAQRVYYYKLKREWLSQMGFEARPWNYYTDRFTYSKYLLVRYVPYPVFCAILGLYQKLKEISQC